MLHRRLVEGVANRLRPGGESLIAEARPVSFGAISLSIGWGLIKRY